MVEDTSDIERLHTNKSIEYIEHNDGEIRRHHTDGLPGYL